MNLNGSTKSLQQSSETLENRLESHQKKVEASFEEAITKLADSSSEIFLRTHVELNKTFEKIATGIDLMNQSLRKLGDHKIPTDGKKKGFFGRS